MRQLIALLVVWFLLFSNNAVGEMIPLRAGPLSMQFDAELAFVRYIKIGEHEVLRGINAPIRNQFWGTVLPQISNLKVDAASDHFSVSFDALCRERDLDFLWHGTITGTADGEVEFTFDGEARSTFLRNRIGFCVLHGPGAAGKPWLIEDSNGETSKDRFPTYISPHQPAKNIRTITHQVDGDVWAHIRFEGEVFEMEDQRNWTDASFKTYCTPLEIPFPVAVEKGTKVSQKVSLKLQGDTSRITSTTRGEAIELTLGDDLHVTKLPRIGLQVSTQTDRLTPTEIDRLRRLHLDHLRVDLTGDDNAEAKLQAAARQADALEVSLQVGLHFGEDPAAELKELAKAFASIQTPLSSVLIISADAAALEMAKRELRAHAKGALFGVGEDGSFVDLNRTRPDPAAIEVVSYGINPQIHAVDNASIIETLPIQADTVRSTMQFASGVPIAISPVTLRPQPLSQQPLPGELPANVDARQRTMFAAGWTIGSVKHLSQSGAKSATYFETVGCKGIMESSQGSLYPKLFPSQPEDVFPVYHVLKEISDFAGENVRLVTSSDAMSVLGLCLEKGQRRRVLVTNLTNQRQSVILRGLGQRVEVYQLQAEADSAANYTFRHATKEASQVGGVLNVNLPVFGIARIDSVH